MSWPFSPLVALVLAGLVLAFARRRVLRFAGVALFLLGWLGSTPLVANLLVGAIESRAERDRSHCDALDAVVLLSGGLQRAPAAPDDFQAMNPETMQRVLALLARDVPSLPLVVAGGGPHEVKEAEVIAAFLQRIAPARAIALRETTSRTTWENAVHTARLLPPPRRVAVATSALHLPRARRAFETVGFSVCPWALDRQYLPALRLRNLLPHGTAVRKTEAVLHELGGWVVYGWRAAPSASE